MKHITYAQKSLLAGDEVCDLLAEYAALLGRTASADTVEIAAIGLDGETVDATFVIGPGNDLLIESTTSSLEAPDNTPAIRYLRDHLSRQVGFDLDFDL